MRQTSFEAVEFLFKASCFLVVSLMFGLWIKKYIDDENLLSVDIISYTEDHAALIPDMSICFRNPFIEDKFSGLGFEVNTPSYLKHLTGEDFQEKYNQIEYNNVTLNLKDYFLNSTIDWRNGSTSENVGVELSPIFSGRRGPFFGKCFNVNTKGLNIAEITYVNYVFRNEILKEYIEMSLDMFIKFHSPNQFLLLENDFEFIPYNKNNRNGTYVELRIPKIEILKRRNKRKEPCLTEWQRWDQLAVLKQIKQIGCLAPYHESLEEFPVCSSNEDMAKFFMEPIDPKSIFKYPPCQTSLRTKIDVRLNIFTEKDKEFLTNINEFAVGIFYPQQITLMTQTQAVDVQTVIGNIGGYIGLFLGIKYHKR